MFIRLGWLTARRNLNRSLLAVVSVAMASMMLVSVTVLGAGMPGQAYRGHRQFLGGDLIVFPRTVALGGAEPPPAGNWDWDRLNPDFPGILGIFHPDLVTWGGLVQEQDPGQALKDVISRIEAHPEVAFVYPYYTYPVMALGSDGLAHPARLRPRVPEWDAHLGVEDTVFRGRSFTSDDDGQPVALIDGFRPEHAEPFDDLNQHWVVWTPWGPLIQKYTPPPVGGSLEVWIPDPVRTEEGRMSVDYTQGRSEDLEVLGHLDIQTGRINWGGQGLTPEGIRTLAREPGTGGPHLTEVRRWTTNEIWVPWETFFDIIYPDSYDIAMEPTELVVRLRSVVRLHQVAGELARELPGLQVLTVDDLVSGSDNLPEPIFMTPPEDLAALQREPVEEGVEGFALPRWFQGAVLLMSYLLAGLLFTGNIYVLLSARRNEIGVLRALGATPGQVLVSLLAESLVVGLSGALLGLVLMSPLMGWHFVSNRLTLMEWWVHVGRTLAYLFLATGLLAAIFGGIPALKMLRRPVKEVLGGG